MTWNTQGSAAEVLMISWERGPART